MHLPTTIHVLTVLLQSVVLRTIRQSQDAVAFDLQKALPLLTAWQVFVQ